MGHVNWQNPQFQPQNQTQDSNANQWTPWWYRYQPGGSKGGGQYQSSPLVPVESPGNINYASGTATDSTATTGTPSIDTANVVTQPVATPAPVPVAPAPVAAAPATTGFNPYRRTTGFNTAKV